MRKKKKKLKFFHACILVYDMHIKLFVRSSHIKESIISNKCIDFVLLAKGYHLEFLVAIPSFISFHFFLKSRHHFQCVLYVATMTIPFSVCYYSELRDAKNILLKSSVLLTKVQHVVCTL